MIKTFFFDKNLRMTESWLINYHINRVLRHPSVVKYIDGVDSDNLVVIVTEPVTPLLQHLQVKYSNYLKYFKY